MDLSKLSDFELESLKTKLENDVSKYSNMQNARKVCLNSAYGALGNQYFRYFDVRQAEAVTLSGQLAIKWVQNDLNQFLNDLLKTDDVDRIIASDTDSAYITLNDVVRKLLQQKPNLDRNSVVDFVNNFCEEGLQKCIDKSFKNLYRYTNGFLPRLEMKRETISDRGIWTAKKHYVVNALDVEGVRYSNPEVKATGLEVVKGSTPALVKTYLKEALRILLQENEASLQKFIKEIKKEFMKASIYDISFPRGVNGMKKYANRDTIYAKSTPMHTRACLLHNHLVKKLNLEKKYKLIEDKEKIRYVYLKEPNHIGENVIGYTDKLPPEFGLDKYVDYERQFDKIFLKPIEDIATVVGWSLEKKNSLF